MLANQIEIQVKEKNGSLVDFIINLQRYAVAGQMFSDITHELNNIVGAMLGFAQIAKMTNKENDIKKCFEVIISCSEKAKQINNSMLSYLQANSKDEREADINTIIYQSISLANKGFYRKGIKVSFLPGSIPIIKLRIGLFQHAFLNLLLDVKKNISNGKELKITTEHNEKEKQIEINLRNSTFLADCRTRAERLESFQDIFNSFENPDGLNKDINVRIASWIVNKEIGGEVLNSGEEKVTGYKIKIPV